MDAFLDNEKNNDYEPIKKLSTQSTFEILDSGGWASTEKPFDPITTAVHEVLIKLVNDPNSTDAKQIIDSIPSMGEDAYLSECRPTLEKQRIVKKLDVKQTKQQPTKKKGGPKKKGNSKRMTRDEIIRQSTLVKAKEKFEQFFKTINITSKEPNFTHGFKQPYVELRLITFLCIMHFYKANFKKISQEQVYELIIAIHRIFKNIDKFPGVSETVCKDVIDSYDELVKMSKFKYEILFEMYPRLCLSTKYDSMFPSTIIKPHDSQVALVRAICPDGKVSGDVTSALILLRAMIGSGKTTGAVAVMHYTKKVLEIHKAMKKKTKTKKGNAITKNLQMIFTCAITHVREDVMRMAFNASIPLAYATVVDGKLEIHDNWNCHGSSDNRVLIVADVPATLELLKKGDHYILFLDEPTVGADTPNNELTYIIAEIIALAPKLTILSSATLPDESELAKIVEYFKSRHSYLPDQSDVQIHNILSKEALIGSQIIRPDGSTLVPFERCKTVDELKFVIDRLENLSFIERLMTPKVTCILKRYMQQHGVPNILDLEEYFSHIPLITQSEVHKVAMLLLKHLVETGDDRLVETICCSFKQILPDDNFSDESDHDDMIQWESANDVQHEQHEQHEQHNAPPKIFTTDAYQYQGCCLVVTADPFEFAKRNSVELFRGQPTFAYCCEQYDNDLEDYQKRMRKLERSKTVIEDETRDQRAQRMQSVSDSTPVFKLPPHLRVGTIDHLEKFTPPDKRKLIDKRFIINPFPLEALRRDLSVPDEAMMLICSGISILSPDIPLPNSSSIAHRYYTKICSQLTSNAQAAFTVSDQSISYGVNCTFRCVRIEEDFEPGRSIQTIVQVMGRSGRLHKSWESYIHIGFGLAEKLLDYIHGVYDNGIYDEGRNINIAFEKAVIEIALRQAELEEKRRQSVPSPPIDNTHPVATIMHNGEQVQVNTVRLDEIQSNPTPPRPDHRPDHRPDPITLEPLKPHKSSYVPPHMRHTRQSGNRYDRNDRYDRYGGHNDRNDRSDRADDSSNWRTVGPQSKTSISSVSSSRGSTSSHSSSCPPGCDGRYH